MAWNPESTRELPKYRRRNYANYMRPESIRYNIYLELHGTRTGKVSDIHVNALHYMLMFHVPGNYIYEYIRDSSLQFQFCLNS
jgi:hypothetical protein